MKLIHDNYLEQMTEELEIINYRLNCLKEAAFGSEDGMNEDPISLLGESHLYEEPEIINQAAYDEYFESLGSSLSAIWRTIVRFIKSLFVSSGEKISSAEAQRIVDVVSSSSADGANIDKKVVQKAFYLLAGLGTSQSGKELADAYRNGKSYEYVMRNIKKLNLRKISSDAEFRIAVGPYAESDNVNYGSVHTLFTTVAKSGVEGLSEGVHNSEYYYETIETKTTFTISNASLEELINFAPNIKTKADANKILSALKDMLKQVKTAHSVIRSSGKDRDVTEVMRAMQRVTQFDTDKLLNHAKVVFSENKRKDLAGSVDADAEVVYLNKGTLDDMFSGIETKLAECINELDTAIKNGEFEPGKIEATLEKFKGIVKSKLNPLVKKFKPQVDSIVNTIKNHKVGFGLAAGGVLGAGVGIGVLVNSMIKDRSPIVFATMTFVNEKKPDGFLKVRMYTNSKSGDVDVKGRDKIDNLRDRLIKFAEDAQSEASKMDDGKQKDNIMEVSNTIVKFFGGLTSK